MISPQSAAAAPDRKMAPASADTLTAGRGALLLLLGCALFLWINRRAYSGYFASDDLDTLGWTPLLPWQHYVRTYFTWRIGELNFRPVGGVYYRLMHEGAGLNFPAWLAALQWIHGLSAVTFWFLLRRLGFGLWAAGTGCLFFAFHPALLDAYSKPMYVFDTACGLFCLLSLLSYVSGRWLLSLGLMFTAYRCKEMAVMLPCVLAVYEWVLGERRWLRLVPFFLLSASFGIQAMLANRGSDTAYSLRFTLQAVAQTSSYYAKQAFRFSWSGLLVLPAAVWIRDRRAYFGLATFWLLLIPLLVLPGRIFSAYLYVPLIGMAILLAAVLQRQPRAVAAAFGVLWLFVSALASTSYAARELPPAHEAQRYVTALRAWFQNHAPTQVYRYRGLPNEMKPWGPAGAVTYLVGRGGLDIAEEAAPDPGQTPPAGPYTLLIWDAVQRELRPETRSGVSAAPLVP